MPDADTQYRLRRRHIIHRYSRGWLDGTIYDIPIPGSFKAIEYLLSEGWSICICSVREPRQISTWLLKHNFVPDIQVDPHGTNRVWRNKTKVLITNRKVAAVLYIDDRGYKHLNWDATVAFVNAIKPVYETKSPRDNE